MVRGTPKLIMLRLVRGVCLALLISVLYPVLAAYTPQYTGEDLYPAKATTSCESDPCDSNQTQLKDWITVENTHINEELALTDNPTYYLHHTIAGNISIAGSPFTYRQDKPSFNTTIYGHSIAGTHLVFSDIRKAWTPAVFNKLGDAHIRLENTAFSYKPLFSLKVTEDQTQSIQPTLNTQGEVYQWLQQTSAQATASNTNLAELSSQIKRLLILVTCSDATPNTNKRTIVVFGQ